MEMIICDISAWDYWRTPPALRDVAIPLDIACADAPDGLGLDWPTATTRTNSRRLDANIRERLLSDLKGITPPVHMMLPESIRYSSDLIIAHRIPKRLPKGCVKDLGHNVGILSPTYLLGSARCNIDPINLAIAMFEACGIYATSPHNSRMELAFDTIKNEGGLKEGGALNPLFRLCEYYDSNGKRSAFLDENGERPAWSACLPTGSTKTDLWKRPPLTSIDQLETLVYEIYQDSTPRAIMRALNFAMDGSASPLESKIALFLTMGMRFGGEGWPKPKLNQRIAFDEAAVRLAHQGHCVADQLYTETKGILEINGEAFHSNDLTFKKETGRTAALESMGYRVASFTFDQISDLENYDSIIAQRAETLGLPLANRTAAFLHRRDGLHKKLFPPKS